MYSAFFQLILIKFVLKKPTIILITFNITRMYDVSLKELLGSSFVRATPLQSYPHFNYWYQVTCSSFRIPEQLTPVRVHRMQMSIRPSVCVHRPSGRRRAWCSSNAVQKLPYIYLLGNLYSCAEY